jgi:fibro-slime domain-containing protein
MKFISQKFFLILFTLCTAIQGAFTIYLLDPWAKDPARDSSLTYIISGEPGWYPGSLMTNDYGNWLMYTFRSASTTSNDRVEFANVIPSANDQYDKKVSYKGGPSQLLIKDIFAGHEEATEVWLIVTDTAKPPQVQFVSPPCKVIRFFKPWDFGGVFIEIKGAAGSYRMRGLGDYCGWLTNKYESESKNISVRFFTTIDSTLYGAKGLKDAEYIDLSTTFAQGDTAWIIGNADVPPSISNTFPGKLGDCGTLRLASKLRDIDTAHPGFNKDVCHSWIGQGIWSGLVKKRLGPDGKPVLSDTVQCLKSIDWFNTEHFDNGYTNEKCFNLVLRKNDEGLYEYDTNEFFPLDSFKYLDNNNTVRNPNNNIGDNGGGHNISFSMETGAEFEYQKGQQFYFRGDDDVWVYIDSQLVVDIGGIHAAAEGSVDLDTLGLTPGKTYSFKLFFCERNCCGSNFRMVTSLNLRTSSKLYHTDTTLSPGTVRYTIYEKVTQDNMACDASSTIIDTVKAPVNFYIEGPSFSTPTKLPAGISYGGITIQSDFTGITIDEPSIIGLAVGEYAVHYFSTKDNAMDGILKFTVVARPRITNPVKSAAFFSDNGKGAVDRVEIFFTDTLKSLPDSLQLMWPSILDRKLITNGVVTDSLNKRHLTVKIATPFPVEITTYSGSSQLGKCFFYDSTFPSNPILTVPFSVADSVGPLIKSAVLVERIEPGNDTLLLTFSEIVKDTSLAGNTLTLFRNGKKLSLPVVHSFHRADTLVVISENQNENSPVITDSIALNSSGPVRDEYGNKAHPDNRPVPFIVRKTPGKLINAFYSDINADGFVDRATLRFNKQVVLSEIKTTFHWVTSLKTSSLDFSRFKFGKDSTEIIVDLSGAFSQKTVITSGAMTAEVEIAGRLEKQTFQVADSAAPVLTSAKIIPGAQTETSKASDKLRCTFSEEVLTITCTNPFQFLRVENQQKIPYEITLTSPDETGTTYTFTISNISSVAFPLENDSVWINTPCGISDLFLSKQTNVNNHRVPLAFDTIRFAYELKMGPNPIHLADQNRAIIITIDPLQKLKQYVNYGVEMVIFNGLGSIIYSQSAESKDAPTVAVSLRWNGHNKKGRIVGCGTYLAVIKIHNHRGNTDNVETVKIGVAP